MANPDLHSDSGTPPAESLTRRDPVEIIDLSSTFDIGDFPSEEENPATAGSAPHAATVTDNGKGSHQQSPVLDIASRSTAAEATGPADAEVDESLTLLEVLESNEHVSWQEAVAIVQELCVQLKDVPSHAPVLIEPGTIQITSAGRLHLLASQQGGDPLVIQLGRLLRSLISTETIPSELRLLISQATFELAIFDSVEQFARALDNLSVPPPVGGVKSAFRRANRHPRTRPETPDIPPATVHTRPLLPPRVPPARRMTRGPRRSMDASSLTARGSVTAAVLAGVTLIGYLVWKDSGVTPPRAEATREVSRAVTSPQLPAPPVLTAGKAPHRDAPSVREREPAGQARPHAPGRAERSPARPIPAPVRASVATPPVPTATSYTASRIPPNLNASGSPADLVRRASALLRDGKSSDAAIVLDLLVLTAPLYEPAAGDLSTDGSAALRASQRLLLPNIASRELDKAFAALSAGDSDGAMALGERAAAMLERFDVDPASPLRARLQQVMKRAGAARATAESVVYGLGDSDVTPAQPLSRQFPEGIPQGIPRQRVGTLELIIGKTGDVEFVKLHTPLNRYHERMIVSAVKAWRYLPAVKAGKPVRFRLTISINLPESGTPSSMP